MSAGSGTLVTIDCATNALWNTIPPIFIFQMVLFRHERPPTSYKNDFISLWIDDVRKLLDCLDFFCETHRGI